MYLHTAFKPITSYIQPKTTNNGRSTSVTQFCLSSLGPNIYINILIVCTVYFLQVPRVSSEPQITSHSNKPSNPKPAQNLQVSTPQQPAAPPPKSSTTGDLIGLGRLFLYLCVFH